MNSVGLQVFAGRLPYVQGVQSTLVGGFAVMPDPSTVLSTNA